MTNHSQYQRDIDAARQQQRNIDAARMAMGNTITTDWSKRARLWDCIRTLLFVFTSAAFVLLALVALS